VSERTMNTP